MLAEVVDPINYARYWYNDDIYWSNVPANILMTEGMSDAYTPPRVLRFSLRLQDFRLWEKQSPRTMRTRSKNLVSKYNPK